MVEFRLDDCQAILGHYFRDPAVLQNALSHSSIKGDGYTSNERLEFLGDSVLGVVVADFLYGRFPDSDEGELTRIKSVVVSSTILAQVARRMGMESHIMVGKGLAGEQALPDSILANVFEAVTGAIYLDSGLEAARTFLLSWLGDQVERVVKDEHRKNFKSLLQHLAQRDLATTPTYRVVREDGPDHLKNFEVVTLLNNREYGRGTGRSKKEAEQEAAGNTLRLLGVVEADPRAVVEPPAQPELFDPR